MIKKTTQHTDHAGTQVAMRFGIVTFFLLIVCFTPLAYAGSAYRVAVISDAAVDNWREGFSISLMMDEKRCKDEFGKDWFQQCAAPAAGEYGSLVKGIRMTPSVDGEWRWESDASMRFHPQKHLTPGTAYTVSLENVPFPSRFSLARTVTYTAQAQAAIIDKEKFWIDPSPKAAHAVSVPVRFIWPVKPGDIEQRIALTPGDARSGLAFGTLRFVWNEDKDEVIVTAPVTSLAAENAIARLTLQGLSPFAVEKGRRVLRTAKDAKAKPIESSFSVTGKSRLMDVSNIQIRTAYGENLGKEYHLEVKTTLRVLPSDVLRGLDVIQLPRKSTPGAGRNANWALMPAISAEDISQGEKLKLELLQPANEAADLIRLRVPAEAGRGLLTAMKTGLTSTSGLSLQQVRRFILPVPSLNAELNFLQPGNVLVLRGEKKLDLHTLGLTSLTWRAERVREPFLALLAREAIFEDPDAPFENMSDAVAGRMEIPKGTPGVPSFPVLDLAPLLRDGAEPRQGLMRLTLTGFNGEKQVTKAERLVLITDMGLIAKTAADGSRTVFVQQLSSGKPVGGVEVRVLGANGLPVITVKTNEQGRADLPAVRGLDREKRPVAVVAVLADKGVTQDMAWLPLNDSARRVDYSSYAVGGRHSTPDGLSASVFSQRGIYLPGETLHFGCIVRRFDWQSLPNAMPLEAVITSPTGTETFRRSFTIGADGLNLFDWTSAEDDATGSYRLDIRLAGNGNNTPILGSVTVRLEEFQPDTLALAASFKPGKPKGWIRTDRGAITAQARLDNLYGEPAADHRVRAEFRTRPGKLRFPGYEDYTFHDPQPFSGEPQTLPLPEAFTNSGGLANFALPLNTLRTGTMQGSILLEGFEAAGGRAVTRQLDALFSPLDVALGYKPEGEANNLNYVPHGAKAALHLLGVDNELNPTQVNNAVLTLSGRRYVNSLVMDSRGEYRYDATPVDTELSRLSVTIDSKGLRWPLPTETPGDFLVTIKKADGIILASIPYSVAGNRLAQPDDLSPTSLAKGDLRLKLDKEQYDPGETIKMRLSAPYAGTGLITVERETVVAHAWFTAKAGDSVQEIKMPAEFEGRGYVNVSFARAFDSDAVYMKPHAYAVAPFTAGVKRRDMGLRLESQARVVPGGQVKVKVVSRIPGRALIFAVDEGVLQLTDFATPDPLRDLLSDRALDVETLQAFDLLMPDHARLRGRIPGFGGGMGNPGGLFLNPFKRRGEPPFAYWREAVEVDEKGTELSFAVPEYLSGRIRIMAVGSAAPKNGIMAVGNAQTTVDARGVLILKPLLPLAVTPGDSFEGALVVANTVDGSGAGAQVKVSMECGPELAFVNTQTSQTLTVDENGEAVLRFRLRANDALGEARVRFSAGIDKGGSNAPVLRTQTLSVRPPSPRVRTEDKRSFVGGSGDIVVERDMYPYQAQGSVSISGVSTLAARSVMARLGGYPYGCTEQLISRALPHAVLLGVPELREQVLRSPNATPGDMEKLGGQAISRAIDAIRRGFVHGEGVSMWPGGQADDFVTAYAADFLLTLRESGGSAPEGLTKNVLNTLENIVMRSPANIQDGRNKLYGAWVLLRDGQIMTQAVERIEQWYRDNTKGWENDVASVLMADSFAMLRLGKRAQGRLPATFSPGTGNAMFSQTVASALHATVIMRNFKERRGEIRTADLVERAFNTNATTVDMAMIARALLAMADAVAPMPADMKLSCTEYAPGFTAAPVQAELLGKSLLTLQAPGCRRYHVELPQGNTATWHAHAMADGFDRNPLPQAANGLALQRRYLDAKGQAVSFARLGDVLTVELRARAEKGTINNVALVDLLPGGFEPVLEKKAPAEPVPGLLRYERREDRGIFFVNLTTEPRIFTYRVRAATKGRFTLPTAAASAMYEPETGARTGGGSIAVE